MMYNLHLLAHHIRKLARHFLDEHLAVGLALCRLFRKAKEDERGWERREDPNLQPPLGDVYVGYVCGRQPLPACQVLAVFARPRVAVWHRGV